MVTEPYGSETIEKYKKFNDTIASKKSDLQDNRNNLQNDIAEKQNNINNAQKEIDQLEKDKQEPFKQKIIELKDEVNSYIDNIKELSDMFSNEILKYAKEVLRSHWKGETIESGTFSTSHGKLTDNLVYMIIMLVDQYAKSGNWVGYSYLDDMKGAALVHLCDVALKFEESKSNNAFSYFTQTAANKFKATLNLEKMQSKIKSRMLQDSGYNATFNEQTNESFRNILYDDDGNEIIEDENDNQDLQEE